MDLVTALGIIVTEATSNAYLHAFPDGPGTISLTLKHSEGKGLTISDNGVGFKAHKESKRHGVGLIKRLMEQEKGSAEIISDAGTSWTLTFPIAFETPKDLAA